MHRNAGLEPTSNFVHNEKGGICLRLAKNNKLLVVLPAIVMPTHRARVGDQRIVQSQGFRTQGRGPPQLLAHLFRVVRLAQRDSGEEDTMLLSDGGIERVLVALARFRSKVRALTSRCRPSLGACAAGDAPGPSALRAGSDERPAPSICAASLQTWPKCCGCGTSVPSNPTHPMVWPRCCRWRWGPRPTPAKASRFQPMHTRQHNAEL
mmetsp:Transcript_13397/g.47279  ORF Transcript_13397/g.47279 Transcript_13397/m.47279 type:complete len:208 (+) Transcript_13397:59-682(+)